MFRRNNQKDSLPSTSYDGGGGGGGLPFGGGNGSLDGSGRAIKMDAPVVKAWKKATGYTRWSYYILAVTIFMVFYGFRSLRYWNGTYFFGCKVFIIFFFKVVHIILSVIVSSDALVG